MSKIDRYEFDLQDWKLYGSGINEKEAWYDAVKALIENYHACMPDAEEIKKMGD